MNTTSVKSRFRCALGVSVVSGFLALSASAQTSIADDFSSMNTETWYGTQSGGTLPAVTDGSVHLTTATASANRSILITNATDINPFTNAVSMTFSGVSLSGSPLVEGGNAAWGNTFFVSLGRTTADAGNLSTTVGSATIANTYYVTGGVSSDFYEGALGFNIRLSTAGTTLTVYDRGATLSSTVHNLTTAAPTDITWTVDGTGATKTWNIDLTFAPVNEEPAVVTSFNGTFSNFDAADLINGENTISRVSIGAFNIGPVLEGTQVAIDGVSISAVPEPSSYALLASAVIGGVVALRRRRHARF